MQPGVIVVLERIPVTVRFDKEAREQFLDRFATLPTTGSTAKSLFAASILFCSPVFRAVTQNNLRSH